MKIKSILVSFAQIIGVSVVFSLGLIVSELLLPMSKEIIANSPSSGFLPIPIAFILNGLINAIILVWAGRRSSLKGIALWAQLLVLSFGAQVFMTQIETAYFLPAFPLLQGNFELYKLILRGLVCSTLVTLIATILVGGFSKKARPQTQFSVTNDDAVNSGSWLGAVYVILYMLFGYFIAWQSRELRLFYNGPAELNSFFEQWRLTLMDRPEILVFQYFRGILWMLCLIPLFKGFSGRAF